MRSCSIALYIIKIQFLHDKSYRIKKVYKHTHAPVPQLPLQFHGLQALLDRLLAKLPEQRFETAAALAAAVAQLAATWQPLPTLNDRRRGL